MNDICKKSTSEKLAHKIEVEKLKTSEIGRGLGISPNYISMILNEKHWNKCPKSAWEAVLKWLNSGYTLNQYVQKYPVKETEKKGEIKTVIIPKPIELNIAPDLKEKIKEADKQMDNILKEREQKIIHPLAVEALQPKQEFTDTARLKIALDIEINLVVNGHKVSMI